MKVPFGYISSLRGMPEKSNQAANVPRWNGPGGWSSFKRAQWIPTNVPENETGSFLLCALFLSPSFRFRLHYVQLRAVIEMPWFIGCLVRRIGFIMKEPFRIVARGSRVDLYVIWFPRSPSVDNIVSMEKYQANCIFRSCLNARKMPCKILKFEKLGWVKKSKFWRQFDSNHDSFLRVVMV